MRKISYDGPIKDISVIDHKQQTKRRRMAQFLLVLLMTSLIVSLLTGCGGFVKASKVDRDTIGGGIPRENGNQLCVEANKEIGGYVFPGGWQKQTSMFWVTDVPISDNSGLMKNGATSNEGVSAIPRNVAILMYRSIFNTEYTTGDQFKGGDAHLKQITLEPLALTKKVNEITVDAIQNNSDVRVLDDALKAMAAAILITVWSMGFISQIVNEKFTMETALKTLMQLLCGVFVITNATTLVVAFVSAGSDLVSKFSEADLTTQFAPFQADILDNALKRPIIGASLGIHLIGGLINVGIGTIWLDLGPLIAILLMALPFFAQLMCAYKIISIMVMRMLELIVRITLAPIPLAFAAQNGFSQEVIRYLRAVLAAAVHPVLIMLGALSVGTIAEVIVAIFGGNEANLTGIIGSIAMALSYFILSAYIGETKQLAKEIIAH